MNKTIRLSIISVILLILAGCAARPLKIDLTDDNFYKQTKTIGILINPSGKPEYDRTLFNALSLYCMALGYQVKQLSLAPDYADPYDRSHAIRGNHLKLIGKIQTLIRENLLNTAGLEALYIAGSKWNNMPMVWQNTETMQLYETQNKRLSLSISTLDASTLEIKASATVQDTSELYVTDETARKFETSVRVYWVPYYPEPVEVFIQRNIYRILGEVPVALQEDTTRMPIVFPVSVYAGRNYRESYPRDWQRRLKERMLYVNDIFKKQFRVQFQVDEYLEWSTKGNLSTDLLALNLVSLTPEVRNRFVIGFVLDKRLARNWTESSEIGKSIAFGNHLVIKDVPSFEGAGNWDALDEALIVAHELGHSFGAQHVLDRQSLMFPNRHGLNYQFDNANRKIIEMSIPQKLQPTSSETYFSNVARFIEIFRSPDTPTYELLPTLSWLLSKDYRGYLNLPPMSNNDILNNLPESPQLADSALHHALLGYRYYEDGDWNRALEAFEKIPQLSTQMPEIYEYCARINLVLGNKKQSDFYRELAEKKGYKISKFQN